MSFALVLSLIQQQNNSLIFLFQFNEEILWQEIIKTLVLGFFGSSTTFVFGRMVFTETSTPLHMSLYRIYGEPDVSLFLPWDLIFQVFSFLI